LLSVMATGIVDLFGDTAIEHGMRIKFPMLLMSSREFRNWARYLPRSPGFV